MGGLTSWKTGSSREGPPCHGPTWTGSFIFSRPRSTQVVHNTQKNHQQLFFFLLMWSLNPKILEIFGGISTVVLCPREPRGQNDRPLRLVSCLEHPESCWESARVWFLGRPISSLWRNTFSTTLRTWLQPLLLKEKRSFIFFYSYVHGTEIQSHEVMH